MYVYVIHSFIFAQRFPKITNFISVDGIFNSDFFFPALFLCFSLASSIATPKSEKYTEKL